MKRFVKKIALGLAVLIALILFANALFVRTAHYRDLGDVEKFSNVPDHIWLSSFGHSHSLQSFAWQEYHHAVTMSFSLGSQTYTYDYAVLTQFWDKMEEGGYVFVALSHFSLYALNEVRWVPRYYRFLDRENIPDYDFVLAVRNRYVPILGASPETIGKAFLMALNLFPDSGEETASIFDGADLSQMPERGRNRVQPLLEDASYEQRDEHGQYEALCRFIEKCREKNLHVILVTTPTTRYYYEAFPQDYVDAFHRDTASILAAYPEVLYLDYTGDTRISENLLLFYDYDHLNYQGAVRFMDMLEEDLLPYGIDLHQYR